jgi:microcin C transport system substrate-binding protein
MSKPLFNFRSRAWASACTLVLAAALSQCSSKEEEKAQDITAEKEAYYKEKSDFFIFAKPEDLPADLEWVDNSVLPEIGSEQAKKGGIAYAAIDAFPATLRTTGPDANGSFRNYLLDEVTVGLAQPHPNARNKYFPGVAKTWAVDPKTQTVYLRLDPDARWSDGEKVTVDDFFFTFFFYQSPYIKQPWYNNWYGTKYTGIVKYDDYTMAIKVKDNKPDLDAMALGINPVPEHFYKEFGPDFPERYQWRFVPTTGAYVVKDEDIKKGRSIALTRVQDWWAKDKKFFKNRYNYDRVEFQIIADSAKAFDVFKMGALNAANITLPEYWYLKLPDTDPDVQKGYIHKAVFYNDRPRPTYGLWINRARPHLDNRDVRVGINFAANFDLVIEKYFRGDYDRMRTTSDGFGEFTHPTLTARSFSVDKAREHFAKAGFTQSGPDGILVNGQGQRLSFTVSTGYDNFKDMLAILKEEARKCGLELNIEIQDGTTAWRKVQEKNHDIAFSAFGTFVEMYPRYWETWHSVNANKAQTNNLCNFGNPEMDKMIETYDASADAAEMQALAHKMEEMLAEDGCFVPGFVIPFYRSAYWRWVKFPEDFNVMTSESAGEWWLAWIDEELKKETLEARKTGKTFPPEIRVFDQYRRK